MHTKSSFRKPTFSQVLSLLLVSATAFGLATGCSSSEAAQAPGARAEKGTVTASRSESETFVAEIKAAGSYKAGAEGTVEVTLVPKGAYHTNAQYPYKFKLNDAPDGVSFAKPILQRADGNFEEKRGSFKVPFTASKAGKFTIAGTLSLSVCSDANCIMDKVALEIPVAVQ